MERNSVRQGSRIRVSPGQQSRSTREAGLEAPTREAIALRAYERFCNRGCEHGFDEQDWLAAEQELGDANQKTIAEA
jgi:hypothetical protein